MIIQYIGEGNIHESSITGASRLWYKGMECDVTNAEATALMAYSSNFKRGKSAYEVVDYALSAVVDGTGTGAIGSVWKGTQAQYDAIAVKDDSTLYVIVA